MRNLRKLEEIAFELARLNAARSKLLHEAKGLLTADFIKSHVLTVIDPDKINSPEDLMCATHALLGFEPSYEEAELAFRSRHYP